MPAPGQRPPLARWPGPGRSTRPFDPAYACPPRPPTFRITSAVVQPLAARARKLPIFAWMLAGLAPGFEAPCLGRWRQE